MSRSTSKRACPVRRGIQMVPVIDTYAVIHGPPPERHAWTLVRDGLADDVSPREQLVAGRQMARRRLARSLTHLDNDQIVALLLSDREASLTATHFRHPSAIPGALESFLCDVKRLRVEQAAAVAKLDTYDALLVDDTVEEPEWRPTPAGEAPRLDGPPPLLGSRESLKS